MALPGLPRLKDIGRTENLIGLNWTFVRAQQAGPPAPLEERIAAVHVKEASLSLTCSAPIVQLKGLLFLGATVRIDRDFVEIVN